MEHILTIALVIITGVYAWFTYKILKANEGVLHAMHDQQDSMYRPYISIFPAIYPDYSIFSLIIKNTGHTAAHNLKLSIDRDFFQFGEQNDNKNLKNLSAFTDMIDSFVPSAEMHFHLAQGFKIFENNADENLLPKVFKITAEYEYCGKNVCESTIIDLRPYHHSKAPHDPLVSKLKEIKEAIEKKKSTMG